MHDDAPLHTSWPRVLGRGVGAIVLAVGLYVLSSGPAFYLFGARSDRIEDALEVVYDPIFSLFDGTTSERPFRSYIGWWCNLPGGPEGRIRQPSTTLPAALDPGAGEPSP